MHASNAIHKDVNSCQRRGLHDAVFRPSLFTSASTCIQGALAGQSIRLRGRNLTESEHVKLGAYHTLELEPQRAFTLEKAAWDSIDIERIRQACDPAASADLAAVLITVLASPFARSMQCVQAQCPVPYAAVAVVSLPKAL